MVNMNSSIRTEQNIGYGSQMISLKQILEPVFILSMDCPYHVCLKGAFWKQL